MEAPLAVAEAPLTVSAVAPAVETTAAQVSELVSLMRSGGAGLTDTQSQKLVAYLGNLEEMRSEIGVMVQRYETDEKVMGRLTVLLDRIDESLNIARKSTQGFTKQEMEEAEEQEEIIIRESIAQQNPSLLVSNFLGISGLLLPRLFADYVAPPEEEEEEPDEDYWNPPLTDADIASLDITSPESLTAPRSLSESVIMDNDELDGAGASILSDSLSLPPSSSSWKRGIAPTSSSSSSTYSSSYSSSSSSVPNPSASASATPSALVLALKNKAVGPCPPTLCKICYEEYSSWKDLLTLANCDHIYCRECLNEYLTVQITSGGVLDLCCPNPECEEEINVHDIRTVCSEEIFEKYGKFSVLAALRADPNVRYCPMPQCSALIQGPPKDGSEWVTCPTCALQVCFECSNERHDPVPCGKDALELIAKRRDAMAEAEKSFAAWHEGKPSAVKPCPKCKAYIEKNQGCNHMTCVSCKHQFCWLCSGNYTSTHFNDDKIPDCKGKQYWVPPVPPSPPDPELQQRYNWIYFPPNYQYEGVEAGPLRPGEAGYAAAAARRPPPRRHPTSMKRIGTYVGLGLAVVTLGIPAAVIGGPIYGVFQLHKRLKRRRQRRNELYELY